MFLLQSVKKDERMFFMWTKEDLPEAKKRADSCEKGMTAYQDKLLVSKPNLSSFCSKFVL